MNVRPLQSCNCPGRAASGRLVPGQAALRGGRRGVGAVHASAYGHKDKEMMLALKARIADLQLAGCGFEEQLAPVEAPPGEEAPAQPAAESSQDWEEALQRFEEHDREVLTRMELRGRMAAAAGLEDYAQAAALKRQLDMLLAGTDTLARLQKSMELAVQEQRFEEAALLRDAAMLGLLGWWRGRRDGDACGHLLHIRSDGNRLIGRVYSAQQLSYIQGWDRKLGIRRRSWSDTFANTGSDLLEIAVVEEPARGSGDAGSSGAATATASSSSSSSSIRTFCCVHCPGPTEASRPSQRRTAGSLSDIQSQATKGLQRGWPQESGGNGASSSMLDNAGGGSARSRRRASGRGGTSAPSSSTQHHIGSAAQAVGAAGEASAQQRAPAEPEMVRAPADICVLGRSRFNLQVLATPDNSGGSSAAPDPAQPLLDDVSAVMSAPGRIQYDRLPDSSSCSSTSGLYLGSFGPHGAELLHLSHVDDPETGPSLVATKLTGDPNVPAGNVSFMAEMGKKLSVEDSDSTYPAELGVVDRYRGKGRVAGAGFQDARWVTGELLLFKQPVLGGAEMGFVWCIPTEKQWTRWLILLQRVQLPDDPTLPLQL